MIIMYVSKTSLTIVLRILKKYQRKHKMYHPSYINHISFRYLTYIILKVNLLQEYKSNILKMSTTMVNLNHFHNKTPRLFKQSWTPLDILDVTLATVDGKQITSKKVSTIGIPQDREEKSCIICDPVVYKTEFEIKEHELAVYEGLISECDYEDTPVNLDGILESTDLDYVEWSFNKVFWDNHRVVSDLEADRKRKKDLEAVKDKMNTKDVTQVEKNINADNEEIVVLDKVEVTEIKFASTDIRYRKKQGTVDSGKERKPPSIKYIDADKEETNVLEKVEVNEIKFASTDIRYRKQQGPVASGKDKKSSSTKRINSEKEGAVALKKIEVTEIKFASTDIRYRKQQGPVNSGNNKKPLSKYGRSHNQYKTKKQNVK